MEKQANMSSDKERCKKAFELLTRIIKDKVHIAEIETFLQTERPVGVDDMAAELKTINDMQKRLATLTALKGSYLDTISELQRRVNDLVKENEQLAYERDCIVLDYRDLQNKVDNLEK